MTANKIVLMIAVLALVVTTVSAQSYEFPKMFSISDTIAGTVGRNAAAADTIAMANIFKIIAEQSPRRNMNFNTFFDDEITPNLIRKYDWVMVGNPSIHSGVKMFATKKLPMNTVELTIHQNPYDSTKIVMVFNGAENREALVMASKAIENVYRAQGSVKLASVNCIKEDTIAYSPCSSSAEKGDDGYAYLKYAKEPMTNMPHPGEPLPSPKIAPSEFAPSIAPSIQEPLPQPALPQPAMAVTPGELGSGSDQKQAYNCESSCKTRYEECMMQEMVGIEKVCVPEYESCIKSCSGEPVYQKKSSSPIDGCPLNHDTKRFAPYGTRLLNEKNEPVYCDIDGNLKLQKKHGDAAQNNYECESNAASDGACLDVQAQLSMLQKIFKFFSSIFGGA